MTPTLGGAFVFMAYLVAMLTALVVTLVVELLIAAAMGYRSRWERTAVISVNLMTNPALALASIYIGLAHLTPLYLVGLEVAVVLAEWRLLVWALQRSSARMFALSLIMNVASYLTGLALIARFFTS